MPDVANAPAWKAELRRLRSSQRALAKLFASTDARRLLARNAGGKFSRFWWIGVIAHDSYHTGQIASLRALMSLQPID